MRAALIAAGGWLAEEHLLAGCCVCCEERCTQAVPKPRPVAQLAAAAYSPMPLTPAAAW